MEWIDNIILGLIELYETNNPYELCDYLKIEIIKVSSDNLILQNNKSVYIRDFNGSEVIYMCNNLNKKHEEFYLRHELGHAVLHPYMHNSLNEKLINIDKIEKQANYFAYKLGKYHLDMTDLFELTVEQIASCIEMPVAALLQLVNI